jgi:hypothetical protein
VTLPLVGPSGDTSPPTAPTALAATAVSATRVDLAWQGSTDNVAVTGYTVSRGGVAVATVPASATVYSDTGVAPATSYSYVVTAVDAAGNRSAPSAPAGVTTPAGTAGPAGPPTVSRPKALSLRVLGRGLTARPGARVRLRFAIGAPARMTISVLRGKKRVSLVRPRAKRGTNAVLLRVPRRVGRYAIALSAHPTGYVLKRARTTLVVRVPARR